MKVLLVTAPLGRDELPVYPLGLAYIATALKGHDVSVVDLSLQADPINAATKIIEKHAPDIIGISLRNIDTCSSYDKYSYFSHFEALLKTIRITAGKTPIMVGGSSFTIFARQVMERCAEIDFGVIGEGEDSVVELLKYIGNPSAVKGICYRENGKIIFTAGRDYIDLATQPLLQRKHIGSGDNRIYAEQTGVQTKRGCIFNCIYCTYPCVEGRSIRLVPVSRVMEDITQLYLAGITKIHFCDSIFNYPKEHAVEICRRIIESGMRIQWQALFNETFIDEEFLTLAKNAGCKTFVFGHDASADTTLLRQRKNISRLDIRRIHTLFRKHPEVNLKFTFMFNGPGESVLTVARTLQTICASGLTGRFSFHIGNMRIYPGTELFEISKKSGMIRDGADLIYPIYYDPFPLSICSCLMNSAGNILYTAARVQKIRANKERLIAGSGNFK